MASLTLDEALDEIACRFIVNLSDTEKSSKERLFFHLEAAHWFYDDIVRPLGSAADQFPAIRFSSFCKKILARIPSLESLAPQVPQLIEAFAAYKQSVPVAGVILLNPALTKCLMVRGHRTRDTWTFPKGKLNEGESLPQCAARELYEETGYVCKEINMRTPFIEWKDWNGRNTRLYIITGISEQTAFGWQTKNEIWDIAWHHIHDALSDKSMLRKRYALASVPLEQLSKWITKRGKKKKTPSQSYPLALPAFDWKKSIQKSLNILWNKT